MFYFSVKRVEEEFQRKRAREKANIRHQLQLFTQEESQQCFTSLPTDWDPDTVSFSFKTSIFLGKAKQFFLFQRRSEPEGASPIPEHSPTGMRNTGTYKKK